jgi:hypothetical protein
MRLSLVVLNVIILVLRTLFHAIPHHFHCDVLLEVEGHCLLWIQCAWVLLFLIPYGLWVPYGLWEQCGLSELQNELEALSLVEVILFLETTNKV